MPNRILRDGILRSPQVAKLSWAEEVFYRRLHSVVDDFGLYYAEPGLLRADCYPRQLGKVSDSDIDKWLRACVDADLVRVYPAQDGERYLQVLRFRQKVRAERSKFPLPPDECIADDQQVLDRGPTDAALDVDVDVDAHLREKAFDRFWAAYPRKTGKGKAVQIWKRDKLDQFVNQMLSTLSWQVQSNQWRSEGGRFIPHPTTWLNRQSWLDEPLGRKQASVVKGSDGKEYDLPEVAL